MSNITDLLEGKDQEEKVFVLKTHYLIFGFGIILIILGIYTFWVSVAYYGVIYCIMGIMSVFIGFLFLLREVSESATLQIAEIVNKIEQRVSDIEDEFWEEEPSEMEQAEDRMIDEARKEDKFAEADSPQKLELPEEPKKTTVEVTEM